VWNGRARERDGSSRGERDRATGLEREGQTDKARRKCV